MVLHLYFNHILGLLRVVVTEVVFVTSHKSGFTLGFSLVFSNNICFCMHIMFRKDQASSVLSSFNTEAAKLGAIGVTVTVSSGDDGVSNSDCACGASSRYIH